ncbi:MAG: hypothetical protein NTX84_06835 [Nitrospirae bacterium]|nr:hypothetical protein [Nitrospirota bacterium]
MDCPQHDHDGVRNLVVNQTLPLHLVPSLRTGLSSTMNPLTKGHLTATNRPRSTMPGLLGIAALTLAMSGCISGAPVAQNVKGSVHLEKVADLSFQANHPAAIDELTIAKIIKGLSQQGAQGGSTKTSPGENKPTRIFSDEDAEFLAPLLSDGLAQAKPDQLIEFHLSSSTGLGLERAFGSLYVQNGSLHVTIGKGNKPTHFTPESAAHSENAPVYTADGALGAVATVIDYRALTKALIPASPPTRKAALIAPISSNAPAEVPAPASAQVQPIIHTVGQETGAVGETTHQLSELEKATEALASKDLEITLLREESDRMKRDLQERDKGAKAIKPKKAPAKPKAKKKQPDAAETR